MLRKLLLLLLVIIELLLAGLVGFLVIPSWGEYWGIGLFIVFLFINMMFGDRLLVALAEGKRPVVGDPIIDTIRNVSNLKGLGSVDLYYSTKFSAQMLVIQKKEREAFVVVGQKLKDKLSVEEMRAMLKLSLDKIASGQAKDVTLFTLVSSLHLPLIIFSKIKRNKFIGYLGLITSYLGTPLNYFMFKLLKLINSQHTYTDEVFLNSALFKMRKIRFETKAYKGQNIADHLDVEPLYRSPIVHRLIESMEKAI